MKENVHEKLFTQRTTATENWPMMQATFESPSVVVVGDRGG